MFAQGIIGLLIFLGFCYLVYKFIIEPRLPNEKDVPEGINVLNNKIELLREMRAEYEAALEEKEVTGQMKVIDEEIDELLREIKDIENA